MAVVQYTYTRNNTGNVTKQTIQRTQKYIEQHNNQEEREYSVILNEPVEQAGLSGYT
jgi:hypothetical protein